MTGRFKLRRAGGRIGRFAATMLLAAGFVSCFVAGACAGAITAAPGARGAGLPRVFLWSWQRADDLRFAASEGVGVAPLVATLTLADDGVRVEGRRQPLALPPGATVLPVVRVELGRAPTLSARQRAELVARVVALAGSLRGSRGVQVDFDAPLSARAFDRAFLADLRCALPTGAWLSLTALASWCDGDRWLADLPVDEVVPMLFRMGPSAAYTRARFGGRTAPACARALGLATDEPVVAGTEGRRVYWFHPGPWTHAALARARSEAP